MNRLLACLIAIALVAGLGGWLWPSSIVSFSPLYPTDKVAQNFTKFSEPDLRQIEEARFSLDKSNLVFGLAPKIEPVVSTPAEVAMVQPPERPMLIWRLAGIIQSPNGAKALFVSSTGNQIRSLGGKLDQWQVVGIADKSVTLKSGSFLRHLVLFDKGNELETAFGRQDIAPSNEPEAARSMDYFGPVRRDPAWGSDSGQSEPKQN